MKFAIAALLATASAIRIRTTAEPSCPPQSQKNAADVFHQMDKDNRRGYVTTAQVQEMLESTTDGNPGLTLTPAMTKWLDNQFTTYGNGMTPAAAFESQYYTIGPNMVQYFHLCAPPASAEPSCPPMSQKNAAYIFHQMDKDNRRGYVTVEQVEEMLESTTDGNPGLTLTPAMTKWLDNQFTTYGNGMTPSAAFESQFYTIGPNMVQYFHLCAPPASGGPPSPNGPPPPSGPPSSAPTGQCPNISQKKFDYLWKKLSAPNTGPFVDFNQFLAFLQSTGAGDPGLTLNTTEIQWVSSFFKEQQATESQLQIIVNAVIQRFRLTCASGGPPPPSGPPPPPNGPPVIQCGPSPLPPCPAYCGASPLPPCGSPPPSGPPTAAGGPPIPAGSNPPPRVPQIPNPPGQCPAMSQRKFGYFWGGLDTASTGKVTLKQVLNSLTSCTDYNECLLLNTTQISFVSNQFKEQNAEKTGASKSQLEIIVNAVMSYFDLC